MSDICIYCMSITGELCKEFVYNIIIYNYIINNNISLVLIC